MVKYDQILDNANKTSGAVLYRHWRRMCQVSCWLKLTDCLKNNRVDFSTRRLIRSCSLKPHQIYVPAGVRQTIFSHFRFPSFELGGIKKHLVTNTYCVTLNSVRDKIRQVERHQQIDGHAIPRKQPLKMQVKAQFTFRYHTIKQMW